MAVKRVVVPDRVIFRRKFDKENGWDEYYAVFPDDPANPGRVAYVPFRFTDYGIVFWGCYDELSLDYYYTTKLVEQAIEVDKCLKALEVHYPEVVNSCGFKVVKKIIRR